MIKYNLWLCVDCLEVAVNGDYSGLGNNRVSTIEQGLLKLGPHLAINFDSETGEGIEEFSSCGCDCCGSKLAGEMYRFAILGE